MFPCAQLLYPEPRVNTINVIVASQTARGHIFLYPIGVQLSAARVSLVYPDQSQGASEGGMLHGDLQPAATQQTTGVSPRYSSAAAAPMDGRRTMIKTPGAVQTSQLILRQAIG